MMAIGCLAIVAAAVVVMCVCRGKCGAYDDGGSVVDDVPPVVSGGGAVGTGVVSQGDGVDAGMVPSGEGDEEGASAADAAHPVLKRLQDAVDEEDFATVHALALEAINSGDREVREALPEALEWFGARAVAPLTRLLFDPDSEIARAAVSSLMNALQEFEDPAAKADVLKGIADKMYDEESVDDYITQAFGLMNDALTVEALIPLIESGNPIAEEKGKEAYPVITGSEYVNPTVANEWIANNKGDLFE